MIRRNRDGKPIFATPAARRGAGALAVAAPLPRDVRVSFEFFPPKNEKAEQALWTCVRRLEPIRPAYVSVTYGAGGTTRERTHAVVTAIQRDTSLTAAAHLTCVGAPAHEVDAVARLYWRDGIRHVVALRGDPPEGGGYRIHPGGYAHASDLVAGLKRVADFEVSVGAFPEVHPEAKSAEADLDNLKRKIDAGASRAITQFFFDVDVYLRFLERARTAGIDIPIVPGILPVTNFTRVVEFSKTCGTAVPQWMADLFDGLDDDPDTRKLVAATVAAEQCRVLHANGVDEFHFYTLNRAELSYAICHILGARPSSADAGDAAVEKAEEIEA